MKYRLQDLIDIEHFQELQTRLNEIYSFPSSIIDNDGNILTAIAWQEICTRFHRQNKEAEKICIKSDQYIKDHIHEADPALTYRCPHGLVDNAIPIIIDGVHYGNFFTGQFFLEEPNLEFFQAQAQKYGFDEKAYLQAVKKVPIWTKKQLDNYLFFIKGLIAVISESGLKRLREIENRKQIEKSENRYRSILKASLDGYWLTDTKGKLLEVNDAYCHMSGYSEKELLSMYISDLEIVETPELIAEHMKKVALKGLDRFESKHRCKDGTVFDVEVSLQFRPEEGGQCVCFLRDITDQKQADRSLRDSEAKYRLLVENQTDLVVKVDLDGRFLFVSPSYCDMFGKKEKELLDKKFMPLVHEDDRKMTAKAMEGLFTPPHTAYLEQRAMTKDGWKWLAWSDTAVLDRDGAVKEIIGIGRDITERKQAEMALKHSELKWRNVLVNTPQIGISITTSAEITFVNEHFLALTGWKENEVIGRNWFDLFIPENVREGVRKVFQTVMGQKDTLGFSNYENEILGKSGRIFNVAWSNVLTKDAEGNVVDVTCLGVDLTERRRSEDKLRKSEIKYRTMMEAIKDPIYICSEDFIIQYMNQAMIDRIGRDATGELCYQALHGFDRECRWCKCYETFQADHTEKNIVSPLDKCSFNVSSTVFVDESGSRSKLSVFRDTTELIELQNRLQQAQKMEAIGNLAGGIAHDFNNILFPIIGMSEMMMEDLSAGSLEHKYANEIHKAGHRAKELVAQILAFSRQSDQKKMPIRFRNILEEVLKLCRATIPANIKIEQKIQRNCGFITGNATQLHQVAMNLITNAYHAVQEKNGKIIISLEEIKIDRPNLTDTGIYSGKYLLFTVSDDGPGMTDKVKNKIFEPYFTTKEQGKGTGLGLAVVYGIVKEYGGEIKVETQIGSGTIFSVYLPLMSQSENKGIAEIKNEIKTGHEHILLVDDDAAVANLERQILERLGYQITLRTGSLDAVEAFRSNPDAFDIVITDMTMPNMTGDQLAKEILSIKPDIPIVICTGFSERINEEQAEAIGVKGFLMKPVVKSDLASMVRKVLDDAKSENKG